ncbi:hypothetical protein EDC39_102204 [Geothermobacter ehrlichii]|uniref:ARG and Rhodanese-Phosphatase-superfamily-associated domain-containing protein n=1 Tax=Geothermobacter ehrlichii TaxID=213224 RepID=A0A5D3WMF8_9BACT|nr:DUF6569 family protein [Geothermobacter ehrlichii]TYO99679.1 hypothetical protein EDC39_102204 [Geothermobacter ehrlichii]
METMINSLLQSIQVKDIQTFNQMSVAPLVASEQIGPDYLTMSQGFAQGVLTVKEVSESGSVPELYVVNEGDTFVLLLDGEEIQGAKQNRVLNTSILVAPKSECVIPVSCTEQGRWEYKSQQFKDSQVVMPSFLRSRKQASVSRNVKTFKSYRSDQHEVWEGVQALHWAIGTHSETGAMRDAFEDKKPDIEKYVQAFAGIKDVNGIAVFLDGKLAGVDFVSHIPAMNDLLPKLIGSYAMSALAPGETSAQQAPSREQVEHSLSLVGRCAVDIHTSQGVGEDARLEGPEIQGAALIALDTVIHMALFVKTEQQQYQGEMASFNRRRHFRRFH